MTKETYDVLIRMGKDQWVEEQALAEFTYGTLKRLMEHKLIKKDCITSPGEPPVYAYSVSEDGVDACREYEELDARFRKSEEREDQRSNREKHSLVISFAALIISILALMKPAELDFISLVKSIVQFVNNLFR